MLISLQTHKHQHLQAYFRNFILISISYLLEPMLKSVATKSKNSFKHSPVPEYKTLGLILYHTPFAFIIPKNAFWSNTLSFSNSFSNLFKLFCAYHLISLLSDILIGITSSLFC